MKKTVENMTDTKIFELLNNKQLYRLMTTVDGIYKIKDCNFVKIYNGNIYVMDNSSIDSFCKYVEYVSFADIFTNKTEAEEELNRRNTLISMFRFPPSVKIEFLEEHFEDMKKIEDEVNEALSCCENFDCLWFGNSVRCPGAVRIVPFNKQIGHCCFMGKEEPICDFTDIDKTIKKVIEYFHCTDTEESIKNMKDFLDFGNKYGWD